MTTEETHGDRIKTWQQRKHISRRDPWQQRRHMAREARHGIMRIVLQPIAARRLWQ